MATEASEAAPASTAGRRASVADELAPLPTNLTAPAHHGRRVSRAIRPGAMARGRLGTLAAHNLGIGDLGPKVVLENTYRMRPEQNNRFNCAHVRDLINSLLESHLAGETYSEENAKSSCSSVADAIRRELKDLDSKRYKYIVSVCIMQLLGQGAMLASRAVGNLDTDNFVTVQFTAKDFNCIAIVHALYYE